MENGHIKRLPAAIGSKFRRLAGDDALSGPLEQLKKEGKVSTGWNHGGECGWLDLHACSGGDLPCSLRLGLREEVEGPQLLGVK